MVKTMKKAGSDPRYSILKGQGHGIQKVYSDQTIYGWLLNHQKRAYERILDVASFWSTRIDSVSTLYKDANKNLVKKNPIPESLAVKKKGIDKFSIFDLF